ncbi:hypothetical protein BH11CYA1_BH11CYA1_25350 [soil metagenome]
MQAEDWDTFNKDSRGDQLKAGTLIDTKVIAASPDSRKLNLNLQPYMTGKYGHLLLRSESLDSKGKVSAGHNCWIQVTDLSLDAFTCEKLEVIASRLSDGKLLEGVELSLNGTGVKAVSDTTGRASMVIPESAFIWVGLVGKKEADSCILTVINRAKFGGIPKNSLQQYAVSDRKLYRPGEKVSILGLLRQRSFSANGAAKIVYPSSNKLHWQLADTDNKIVREGDYAIDERGVFSFDFLLPEKMQLGSARIFFTAPSRTNALAPSFYDDIIELKIEEFRRPEFESTLSSSKGNSIFIGDETTLVSNNNYLAGGALKNAVNNWVVVATPSSYDPPSWRQYKFDNYDHRTSKYWENFQKSERQSLQVQTNSHGEGITKLTSIAGSAYSPISFDCTSTVTDVNRQSWSSNLKLIAHPANIYVGIEAENFKPGNKVKWKIVATDLDGKIVAGTKVDLACCVSDKNDHQTTTSRQIIMGTEPAIEQFNTNADSKIASLSASIKDSCGRINKSFKLATVLQKLDANTVHSQYARRTIAITTDKTSYKVGDIAKVTIKFPDGPANGFLIIPKDNSFCTIPLEMDGPKKTIELPITENYYPQIGLSVLLTANREQFATGSYVIEVPPLKKSLTLGVNPSSSVSAPKKEITLAIDLKDQDEPAANGRVSIAVVDEAILALAKYRWQNPLNEFYKRGDVSLDMRHSRTQDTGMMITVRNSRIVNGVAVEPEGQNDREEKLADYPSALRHDLRPLAFCQSAITTDSKGKAEVKFTLPDSVTRYRIMAFAAAEAGKFGVSESTITTTLPLMVKPSPPRFLNYGDSCQLPIVIQNKTNKPLSAKVALRSNGAQVIEPGMQVVVPASDRVEVRFNIKATSYGQARFQCVAKADQLSDAAEFSLPIMTAASSETFATYGAIDKGAAVQKLATPTNVIERFGGLTVSTSSSATQNLTESYEYLRRYQYDCSEQLSSRLIAMLSLQDTLQAFGALKADQIGIFKRRIEDDIALLEKRQNQDGSFALWQTNEKQKWPYVSAQVTQSLVLAKAKLYQVDAHVLKQALSHLKEIEKDLEPNCGKRTKIALQAKALNVRHLAHDDDSNAAKELLHKAIGEKFASEPIDHAKQSLSLEVAAWLLPILKTNTACAEQVAFIRKLLNSEIRETASTASANDSGYGDSSYRLFYSPRRLDAVVTEALIEDQPENKLIPKLVKGLLAGRQNGIWQGTQENCCVLQTLDKYFSTFEKQTPDFEGQTWLNDTLVANSKFVGRSLETKSTTVPMQYLLSQGKPSNEVLINKQGPGRLYYRLALDYASKNLNLKQIKQGFTVSRTYEAVDAKSDLSKDKDDTWHIKAGSTVRVKVKFETPGIRYHVALNDPFPAGAEAVNDRLQGTRKVLPDTLEESSEPHWSAGWKDHENLRDHQAEAFSSHLAAGQYEYSYLLRATTPGRFTVPPTKVEEMYMSETFGRTHSDVVVIE